MSLGVVSIPNFESWLVLHTKWCKLKLAISTDCLKKHDFSQMTSNIDILYTVKNHFSSWIWIQDRYLKIRLRLARINCQSFVILHGNVYWRSGHFHRQWRVPLWRGGWEELIVTYVDCQNWLEDGDPPLRICGLPSPPRLSGHWAQPWVISPLWVWRDGAHCHLVSRARWSAVSRGLCEIERGMSLGEKDRARGERMGVSERGRETSGKGELCRLKCKKKWRLRERSHGGRWAGEGGERERNFWSGHLATTSWAI